MAEHFSGLVFALIKNKLPDFRPIFERYALDLKKEAELRSRLDKEIYSAEHQA